MTKQANQTTREKKRRSTIIFRTTASIFKIHLRHALQTIQEISKETALAQDDGGVLLFVVSVTGVVDGSGFQWLDEFVFLGWLLRGRYVSGFIDIGEWKSGRGVTY